MNKINRADMAIIPEPIKERPIKERPVKERPVKDRDHVDPITKQPPHGLSTGVYPCQASNNETMAKPQWSDLSSKQQAMVIALGSVQLGLIAAAHIDLSRRDATQVNGPKPLWRALTLVSFVGPIAYFRFGRRR